MHALGWTFAIGRGRYLRAATYDRPVDATDPSSRVPQDAVIPGECLLETPQLRAWDVGRIPYADAYALQLALHAQLVSARERGGAPATLLLLEHDPPVVTVSRRPSAPGNVLLSREALAARGVELVETDRGGDVTWHGPGQLVAYGIADLNAAGLRIHGWMRLLEESAIRTVAHWGIDGARDETATGVWVGGHGGKGGRKVCALGVRVSRWCTFHGLALNVAPDLRHFDAIVPCGLAGRPVTSMEAELGGAGCAPPMSHVKRTLARAVADLLAR
jgi:lipoyl(octanoyl) transferase